MSARYRVVVWHGESRSTFYVVDFAALDAECQCVVSSHDTKDLAKHAAKVYNAQARRDAAKDKAAPHA